MNSVRIIKDWLGFERLKQDWRCLLTRSDADVIFLTWEWIDCWRRSQINPITPLIVVIEKDDVVVAIAPLYRCQYRLLNAINYRALRFLGDKNSGAEYSNFIVDAAQRDALKTELWEALLSPAIKGEWDVIWLHTVASWTPAGQSFIAPLLHIDGIRTQQRTQMFAYCPLNEKPAAILSQVSRSLRKNIQQTQRRLDKLGDWEIVDCQEQGEMKATLARLFYLHQKHWESKGRQGSFQRSAELQCFYQHFVLTAFKQGWLKLYYLKSEGVIQAVQLGYVYQRQFLALQEGYDPTFLAGTGQVLRHYIMQRCYDDGLIAYDFLAGYTDHKRRWLAQKMTGSQYFIFQNRLKNLPFYAQKIWPSGSYLTMD